MTKLGRRGFLVRSAAGMALASAIPTVFSLPAYGAVPDERVDTVALGNTGLNVSRIAFGTGSKGWKLASDQTRLGMQKFVGLSQYCFDKGIRFFDTADMYGSHPYVGAALKVIPREKSLNYVIKSGNVHCMTLGMESKEQVDDNVSRVMRIVKS